MRPRRSLGVNEYRPRPVATERCSLAAALLVLASGSAHAVTPEQVFNEMSQEMVECSVYFTIVTNGLQKSNDLALAERYERARDDAGAMALKLNKMAGLKDDVALARIKIAQQMMSDRIGGNTSNVSVLLPVYGELCTQAINKPKQQLNTGTAN